MERSAKNRNKPRSARRSAKRVKVGPQSTKVNKPPTKPAAIPKQNTSNSGSSGRSSRRSSSTTANSSRKSSRPDVDNSDTGEDNTALRHEVIHQLIHQVVTTSIYWNDFMRSLSVEVRDLKKFFVPSIFKKKITYYNSLSQYFWWIYTLVQPKGKMSSQVDVLFWCQILNFWGRRIHDLEKNNLFQYEMGKMLWL